ncbi:MAG: TolC family protein [Proteobacteria bacterium]|nr:TolC family protein [Pseudomonadota bacterium]
MRPAIFSILAFLFVATPIFALTMDEAVELALKNSHQIREQKELYHASAYRLKSAKGGYYPDLNLSYTYIKLDHFLSFQTNESSVASIEAKYNLFNGFMDRNDIKAAAALVDAKLYQKKAVEADIVLEVKIAFVNLLRAKKNHAVAQEAVNLLESQKRDIELHYREGLVAKNEVLKVDVELASSRQVLLLSESTVKIAAHVLERVMGVKLDGDREMEALEETGDVIPEYDDLLSAMLTHRSELKYMKALKQSKNFDRKSARGEYLPTVDFSFRYSKFGDTSSPSGRAGLHDDEKRTMLEMEWELADGIKKRHNVRAAEADLRAADAQLKDLEAELVLQLKQAVEGYKLARSRVEVATKAIKQAEENYRITDNQFKQRMATSTDVLDARVFLSRAKNDYNNAFYDLQASIAAIERVEESFVKR